MKSKTTCLLGLFILLSGLTNINAQENQIDQLIAALTSSEQNTRDQAAKQLRNTYVSSPKSKWIDLVGKIQKGQTKKDVFEIFKGHELVEDFMLGSGRTHSVSYRLDNDWALHCAFMNESDELLNWELTAKTKSIWVGIPNKQFNGTWITYFVNGQKANEINYKDGSYFGELIAYHSDGSKSYVQHYDKSGANGTDTGYFPSGKVSYQGTYEKGKQCGTWNHFDESGKVISTQEYAGCSPKEASKDAYKIEGKDVTKETYEAKKKELKEIPGTYHCAKTVGGGRNSYEAKDANGVIWLVHNYLDGKYSKNGISRK
jgi:hypothetical protein